MPFESGLEVSKDLYAPCLLFVTQDVGSQMFLAPRFWSGIITLTL